ncbi:fungal hydrophobin-domain-containing protein [Lenzites betulinus]|nr:fungal hydrophobin-domain-containing protein [Lenzites betulinus]
MSALPTSITISVPGAAAPSGPSQSSPNPGAPSNPSPPATGGSNGEGWGQSQCNTGPIQCCNDVQSSESEKVQSLAGLLGMVLKPNTMVGLQCSPINVIGVGSGNSCSAHTVCCENNSRGGLINIGCVPIML